MVKKLLSIFIASLFLFSIFVFNVNADENNKPDVTQTGWLHIDDKWFYIKDDGNFQTEWLNLNGIWYYFNNDGIMQTGWLDIGDSRYYINEYGAMQTGWLELDENRYYLSQNGEAQIGWAIIEDEKYLFDNKGKCVEGAHKFVIDISKWQGNIDWDKLAKTDVDAVILRSSYGGQTFEDKKDSKDIKFDEYIENLNRLKIPYGTYHFNTATTVEVAKIQAQNVVDILKETGANPSLPVFVDIETNGGKCDLTEIAKVYISTFISNGYKPGIYANENYWKNYLSSTEFDAYYKWIANYGSDNGYPSAAFAPEDGIESYMMWQYTSNGEIEGISENTVDFNALFDWYLKPDGWQELSGRRYHYSNGYLTYGWFYENNNWYYLKASGEMATGWIFTNNTWYYLNANGTMQTGWINLNGTWYYLNSGGAMQTGWAKLNDIWYYFNGNGAMQTGWQYIGNTWYYLNNYGAMQTGWLNLNGTWYYLNSGGAMQTGWLYLNNTWYYLDQSGAWVK